MALLLCGYLQRYLSTVCTNHSFAPHAVTHRRQQQQGQNEAVIFWKDHQRVGAHIEYSLEATITKLAVRNMLGSFSRRMYEWENDCGRSTGTLPRKTEAPARHDSQDARQVENRSASGMMHWA